MQKTTSLLVALISLYGSTAFAQTPALASCPPTPLASKAPTAGVSLRATLAIEVNNNHVFVPICHNGRTLTFILDTGAPSSYFDLATARQQDIALGQSYTVNGVGAGAAASADLPTVTVVLAGSAITQSIQRGIDFASVARRDGHHIDGLLGRDFIERFVLRVDYQAHTLEVHDRDRFRYEGSGVVVPIKLQNDKPYVDADVLLDDGSTVNGHFLVDVGSSQVLNFGKHWMEKNKVRARITPTIRARGGSGIGGATAYDVGRVASIRIGGVSVLRPIAHLHGDSAGYFSNTFDAGSIGGALLRRFHVIIDYKQKRFILERNSATDEPFETDMSGVTLSLDQSLSRIVVEHVDTISTGGHVPLAVGDTIIAVNGEPTSTPMLERLRALFRKRSSRIELTVLHGNGPMQRVVTTADLLRPA